jgi:hypothetical protein
LARLAGPDEEIAMRIGRVGRAALLWAALVGVGLFPGCRRRSTAEVSDVTASFSVNRTAAPLGSAIEVTYTWTTGPAFKKIDKDYRALVHFLDSHKVLLFTDDHVPTPPPTSWEAGNTYTYKRTVFIPIYPYVGDVRVVMGLSPTSGKGERLALKGEDLGLREYKVATIEFQPQTENIFLAQKEGWHNPESLPENPSVIRQWTKKEALVSFKNPKKDILIYLEADTCAKCFPETPVLTATVAGKTGIRLPIENGEVFLKKVRVKAADLGADDWVDLRFAMNQSFVPKAIGMNNDDRELGLCVYHLYLGEADKLGKIPEEEIVDATVLAPAAPVKTAAKTPAKTLATPAKSPAPAKEPAKTPAKASPSPSPKP